jgi:hypothetical protein
MSKYFWGSCLLALFATGCNSSPSTPADTTTATSTVAPVDTAHPAAMSHLAGMSHADHLAAMPGMSGPAPTGNRPRAQAMRLHDATMNQLDALTSERQRLTDRLAQLSPTVPSAYAAPWLPYNRPICR